MLSHYPNIDSSQWLKKEVMDHRLSFQRKDYGLNALKKFLLAFLPFLWFSPEFVVVFIIIGYTVTSH